MNAPTSINQILNLFELRGEEAYYGEEVSQLQHAIQSAALAKAQFPGDSAFIIAAFLHDIGHICGVDLTESEKMGDFGSVAHEKIGASFLESFGLPSKVINLVNGHVSAKRYLVSTDSNYYNALSEASKLTLVHQGGKMTAAEIEAFQLDPLFHQHIALRKIDEKAKVKDMDTGSLEWIREMLGELIQN